MKTLLWVVILLFQLLPRVAAADSEQRRGPIGVGLMVGDPVGVSVMYRSDASQALSLGAGFDMGGSGDLHLHADYLRSYYPLDPNDWKEGLAAPYAGIGVRVRFLEDEDDDAGLRVPLGVTIQVRDLPIDVFAEVAPVFVVLPDLDFDVDWGFGVRGWF
jgi:hypothetical protein